jgi:hypothetical protein
VDFFRNNHINRVLDTGANVLGLKVRVVIADDAVASDASPAPSIIHSILPLSPSVLAFFLSSMVTRCTHD